MIQLLMFVRLIERLLHPGQDLVTGLNRQSHFVHSVRWGADPLLSCLSRALEVADHKGDQVAGQLPGFLEHSHATAHALHFCIGQSVVRGIVINAEGDGDTVVGLIETWKYNSPCP